MFTTRPVIPPLPPEQPKPEELLSGIVQAGTPDELRSFFDDLFWRNEKLSMTWESHLLPALARGDRHIVRLLVLYGARATEENLAELKQAAGDKYPDYLRLLRQAGHRVDSMTLEEAEKIAADFKAAAERQAQAAAEAEAKNPFRDHKAANIPQEWLEVLHMARTLGPADAIIAGGALRDTFNHRPVKDVDIFLETRGSEKKNRKYIQKIFEKLGMRIQEEVLSDSYSGQTKAVFPSPRETRFHSTFKAYAEGVKDPMIITQQGRMQSWKIVAGANKTEYNIVFVSKSGIAFKNMMHRVLSSFDLNICQIATDGEGLGMTPGYKNDIREQTITLNAQNSSSAEHLQRVMEKYNTFKLSDSAKKMLEEDARPKSRQSSHSWGS